MKSFIKLITEYEDLEQEVFDRVISMKQRFENILDDNDCDSLDSRLFRLPTYGEELINVSFLGYSLLTTWEFIDSFDGWDRNTEWRIPIECFDMDDLALERYVLGEYKEVKKAEDERSVHSLNAQAEMLGYKLEKM